MKTTYIYFGQKGYLYETDSGANQTINGGSTLTLAAHGMVPIDHTRAPANVSTSTDAYRVVVKAATSAASTRGATFTNDFVTNALFSAGSDATPTTSEIGDVTELNADSWGVSSGVITIANYATDNDNGYLCGANDKFWVEQKVRHDTAGNGASASNLSSAFAYPMTSFLGADPVAYAGEHYDGTALDQTDLHFLKSDGSGSNDIIRIIHTAGKYPDLVKTMEAIANCGVYDRAVTFYDLDINGVETFAGGSSLSSQNDLGIVGCWRTTA
tara:strand:+ start:955 stop:1764 length:810 start_codon:yes stop_codon:yes gene_type:complete